MAVDHSVAYLGWTIDDVSVTTASRSAAPTKITALSDRSVIGYNVYRFAGEGCITCVFYRQFYG